MGRDVDRRTVIRTGIAAGVAGVGLLSSRGRAADSRPAFAAKTIEGALQALYGSTAVTDSDKVSFRAIPDIAENGAVVPVTVTTTLAKVEEMLIFGEANPTPLVARCIATAATGPELSIRLKLGNTGNVVAIVKADGKLYRAAKEVKVTIGGFG